MVAMFRFDKSLIPPVEADQKGVVILNEVKNLLLILTIEMVRFAHHDKWGTFWTASTSHPYPTCAISDRSSPTSRRGPRWCQVFRPDTNDAISANSLGLPLRLTKKGLSF